VEVVILAKLPDISRPQFHLPLLGALAWWHAWRCLVAKVGTSNQDRTVSLKAALCSCTNKQTNVFTRCSTLLVLSYTSFIPTSCFIFSSRLWVVIWCVQVIKPVTCTVMMTLHTWACYHHCNSKSEGGSSMFFWNVGSHGRSKVGESALQFQWCSSPYDVTLQYY